MGVHHDQGMYEELMHVKLYKGLPRSRCNTISHELRITNLHTLSSLFILSRSAHTYLSSSPLIQQIGGRLG